mgnify:CR=1 FL=1
MIIARIFGFLFLALGAIGIFIPVWPTTVFWIVAAICFARSSPVMRDWIYQRPGVGPPIQEFIETGALGRSSKIGALVGMGMAATLSTILLWGRWVWLGVAIALIGAGAAYVSTRPKPG